MTQTSLKQQLLWQLGLGFAFLGIILYAIIYHVLIDIALEAQDNLLRSAALSISESIFYKNDNIMIDIPYSALVSLDFTGNERVYYAIYNVDNILLTGYDNLYAAHYPTKNNPFIFENKTYLGESIRLTSMYFNILGENLNQNIIVTVAQTQNNLKAQIKDIIIVSAMISTSLFIIASLISYIAVSRSLRPIQNISNMLKNRKANDFSHLSENVPNEIQPIIKGMNLFIQKLNDNVDNAQRLILDAAHQIRTPLTSLSAQTEIAIRRAKTEPMRARLTRMLTSVYKTSRVATQILNHAMLHYRVSEEQKKIVHLNQLLKAMIQEFDIICEDKSMEIILDANEEVSFYSDEIIIAEIIRNLLNNALRYGYKDTDIKVNIQNDAKDNISISIFNQGPCLSDTEIAHITRPFERGKNATDDIGSGLGLTIVEGATQQLHGEFMLKAVSNQGMIALITLPKREKLK